jgi:hypothetical protein
MGGGKLQRATVYDAVSHHDDPPMRTNTGEF